MQYILLLTIIMPPNAKDIERKMNMPSLQECWDTAHAWVQEEDIRKKVPTAIGLAAACGMVVTGPKL